MEEADFSQQQVIWQARREPGLVVHGPPGTGKSQVIVNTIADALANQQTVLMVCQKQVALQVVLERLKAVGLGDFCMEIQDAEADRMKVFRAIRDQVERLNTNQRTSDSNSKRTRLAGKIAQLEAELDRYAHALNAPHPHIGIGYRHLLARLGELATDFPSARVLPELQAVLTDVAEELAEALRQDCFRLGNLFCAADFLHNPWRDRHASVQPGIHLAQDLQATIEYLQTVDQKHFELILKAQSPIHLPAELEAFQTVLDQVLTCFTQQDKTQAQLLQNWLRYLTKAEPQQVNKSMIRARQLVEWHDKLDKLPEKSQWTRSCQNKTENELHQLKKDADYILEWVDSFWFRLNISFYKAIDSLRAVRPAINDNNLKEAAQSFLVYFESRRLQDKIDESSKTLIPGLTPDVLQLNNREFATQALHTLQIAQDILTYAKQFAPFSLFLDAFIASDKTKQGLYIQTFTATQARIPLAQALLKELPTLNKFVTDEAIQNLKGIVLAGQSAMPWLSKLQSSVGRLHDLMALEAEQASWDEQLQAIFACFLDYEKQREDGKPVPQPPELDAEDYGQWWQALFEFSLYRLWQQQYQRDYPELLQLRPHIHTQKVAELRQLLQEKRDLDIAVIQEIWQSAQKKLTDKPWKRIFQLRSSKKNRAMRLREALDLALAEGVLQLRPCWLVNPETASKIFPLNAGLFDRVIFDEASQCPLEQAIPAVYRGRIVVVAGDEKQLPPTSFFSARSTDDFDEDSDAEADDAPVPQHEAQLRQFNQDYLLQAENLLQASIGSLPERYLQIHYRSRYPALIQFSNHAFYSGLLEAPPNAVETPGAPPIEYHEVNGIYQQRQNKGEAEYIVKLLQGWWSNPSAYSIGVVTFNQPQRELIEDLLENACQQDAAFARRYTQEVQRKEGDRDTGFFVKNLENVQGDERDVMIFSTTFGPDAQGRFYRRFGPVGMPGGERRLNVAVTRAKHAVLIVGSMPIGDIADALRNSGDITPAGYLQLYLNYAQAVAQQDSTRIQAALSRIRENKQETQGDAQLSPLAQAVKTALEQHGYTVHSHLGESGFRIDLAVCHPVEPGYILGIDCDGAPYFQERSARTRDVWRDDVLQRWGWRLYRVWSEDWWANPAGECEKLVGVLKGQ